jgi:hypothetical protein
MDDDSVNTFVAFTNATPDVARRYLGMTEGNPQQAIQLYFDSPDLASGVGTPSAAPPIPASSRPPRVPGSEHQDRQGVAHLDSDGDDMDIDNEGDESDSAATAAQAAREADLEDDAAMARRMQEEFYTGGDASGGYDAEGVRAPLARTTETLVGGPGGDWTQDDMQAAVLQQMRARQRPQARPQG